MAHLRTFQTGQNSTLSQRLLNEVSAARICLLNPDKKAAYDEELRSTRVDVVTIERDTVRYRVETPIQPPAPDVPLINIETLDTTHHVHNGQKDTRAWMKPVMIDG